MYQVDPQDTVYYKLLNPDWAHHGYQWRMGLNVDPVPLDPRSETGRGGLYFCRFEHLFNWYRLPLQDRPLDDYWLATVRVPAGTEHWTNGTLHKAQRLVLEQAERVGQLPQERYEQLCLLALRRGICELDSFLRKTPLLCLEQVKRKQSIRLVPPEMQTEELVLCGVRDHYDIQKVRKDLLTQEVWDLLPEEELRWVPAEFQTVERCWEAVKEDTRLFRWVHPPLQTKRMLELATRNYRLRWLKWARKDLQTPELCLRAVLHDPSTLEHVREDLLTDELKARAVARVLKLLHKTDYPLETVMAALQQGKEPHQTILAQLLGLKKIDVDTAEGRAILSLYEDLPDSDQEEKEEEEEEQEEEEDE